MRGAAQGASGAERKGHCTSSNQSMKGLEGWLEKSREVLYGVCSARTVVRSRACFCTVRSAMLVNVSFKRAIKRFNMRMLATMM